MTGNAADGTTGSPLRQRMIDQMRIANPAESTRITYIGEIEHLARHYKASPEGGGSSRAVLASRCASRTPSTEHAKSDRSYSRAIAHLDWRAAERRPSTLDMHRQAIHPILARDTGMLHPGPNRLFIKSKKPREFKPCARSAHQVRPPKSPTWHDQI